MKFYDLLKKLNKPIVFFDLETTGIDTDKARIIEIGAIRYNALDENDCVEIDRRFNRINPEMEISAEITELTGITNEILKDSHTFKEISNEYIQFFNNENPIIAGYNHVHFDVPILAREFANCGLTFPLPDTKYFDMLKIFRNKFPMTLENAFKYYVSDVGFVGAHNALNDTQATADVFQKQLEKYPDLEQIDIHEYCGFGDMVDFAGKLKKDENGFVIYTFGKYVGKKVLDYPDYASWMLTNNFPEDTKICLKRLLQNNKLF